MATECDQGPFELRVTSRLEPQAEAVIENGLANFNREQAGHVDSCALGVIVSEAGSGQVVGGLLGRTSLGIFFVDLIFLPDTSRGQGLGSRVMAMAEAEARQRCCTAAVLFTIVFQAPDFYARLGYLELGRIECDPPGHTRVCMTKRLV